MNQQGNIINFKFVEDNGKSIIVNRDKLKIFNLSLPKTATTSFGTMSKMNHKISCDGHWKDYKSNFLILAENHNNYQIIDKIVESFDTFSDAPFGGTDYYKHANNLFLHTKFFLVSRDEEDWYKSFVKMLDYSAGPEGSTYECIKTKMEYVFYNGKYGTYVWLNNFCNGDFTKSGLIKAKKNYERNVCSYFKKENNFKMFTFEDFINGKANDFLGFEITIVPHSNKAKNP